MRRQSMSKRLSIAAIVCTVVTLVFSSLPASALNSQWSYNRYLPGGTSAIPVCIQEDARQNHGGAILSRYLGTYSMNACGQLQWRETNNIAHRGTIYKNGQFCLAGGWQYNSAPGGSDRLIWQTNQDIWPSCNFGSGVHVYISHDVTAAVFSNRLGYWTVREARDANGRFPTTAHCHCP